jgi:hypothetical protein
MNGIAPKELFLKQVDMDNTREILDALVLLINSSKFLVKMQEARFEQILGIVKCPAFGDTRMKCDVIAGQLAAGPEEPEKEEPKTEEVVANQVSGDDLD